jgi:hypothetical protein
MSRQDQYRVVVTIDDENTGVWDKVSGFETDSSETKYKPGGLAPEVPLGGSVSVSNGTVSRLYDLQRDHQSVKRWLGKVGKADVIVNKQPLDIDGNIFGDPLVYTGKLKMVSPPEVDSESSDAALLEIEVSSAAIVG